MAANEGLTEPIEGYDDMTVAEIVAEMEGMDADEVQAVKDYEAENKARKGVLSFEDEADSEGEPKPAAKSKPVPVVVDNRTARSDEDAQHGQWVEIVGGDYTGRRAAFISTATAADDGYPETVVVRTRDANNELITVDYADVRPTDYTGGR